uniref:Uncharacterized protein n=1 Tax=Anguilla anguilla TaxID=7936 RepID=A0A0E9RSB8_ANGAN
MEALYSRMSSCAEWTYCFFFPKNKSTASLCFQNLCTSTGISVQQ